MARVTVEDCVSKIPNRFELVVTAGQRARQLAAGAIPTIKRNNDKNGVVALREIAEETVDIQKLNDATLMSFRRQGVNAPFAGVEDEDGIHRKSTFDLSLTGEVDEMEAALEAEFADIESGMQIEDADTATAPLADDTISED